MAQQSNRKFDLIVVGSGLAGSAAACFALKRGLKIARVSATGGEMSFASGLLDLLGIYPTADQTSRIDPWEGVGVLCADVPDHPYAKLGADTIRNALEEFVAFLETAGLAYRGLPNRQRERAHRRTAKAKITYRVPHSMWNGVKALEEKLPTLLVDFEGMKDFNAGMIVGDDATRTGLHSGPYACLFRSPSWGSTVQTPCSPRPWNRRMSGHVSAKHSSPCSVMPKWSACLRSSGFAPRPASSPTSRNGSGREYSKSPRCRLRFRGCGFAKPSTAPFPMKAPSFLESRQVLSAKTDGRRCTALVCGMDQWRETLQADGIILATGRFLGGGLAADQERIVETIFGLPVTQPPERNLWHRSRFLDHRGHPVNEAGLEIDDRFRPLGTDGKCALENLFAAGSVLAHQDWVRTKSGAGLAIATAYGAIEGLSALAPVMANQR